MKRAICITNGEQGENHAGMQKIGKGLADKGYTLDDALKFKSKFEEMGGTALLYDLRDECGVNEDEVLKENCVEAFVLKFEDGVNVLFRNKIRKEIEKKEGIVAEVLEDIYKRIYEKFNADKLFEEQFTFEWDKKYWDTRRSKVLNKHARHNVCYGKEQQEFSSSKRVQSPMCSHAYLCGGFLILTDAIAEVHRIFVIICHDTPAFLYYMGSRDQELESPPSARFFE